MIAARNSFSPRITLVVLTVLIAGCAHTTTPPADIVATWSGGALSADDLAQWRLFQPATNDQGLEETCTDMAMVLFLAAETEVDGVDTSTTTAIEETADHLLARRLRASMASQVEIPPAEIEAAYREHPNAFHRPRKVRLRNLYLSFPPDSSEADRNIVREEMEELQRRILDGEAFATLAGLGSHSQTRFKQGLMGNVSTGTLPPSVEALVMHLQPGEMSSVLETSDGLTIFWCDEVIEAWTPTPDEVRDRLATNLRRMEDKKQWAELKLKLAGEADISDGVFAPKAAAEARRLGLDGDPEIVAKIRWMRLQRLATEALRRRVELSFEPPSETEVLTFFEAGRSAFATDETVNLSVIGIDSSEDPRGSARQAFELSFTLRHGAADFTEAVRAHSDDPSASNDGRLDPLTRRQLAGRGPEFMKTVTGLEPGEISREVMADGSWWVLRLDDRQASRTMKFDEAKATARTALTRRQVGALQDEIEADIRFGLDVVVLQ